MKDTITLTTSVLGCVLTLYGLLAQEAFIVYGGFAAAVFGLLIYSWDKGDDG
jgi:hypothetical protein